MSNPIYQAASELQSICEGFGFSFSIIGGIAVQRWGHPRMTADVDLTLLTGFGNEEFYVDQLLSKYKGRLSDSKEFSLLHRTLLLVSNQGIPLDISLAALPFEERIIERSSIFNVDVHTNLLTCSAEDLIIQKTFAGRDKDWMDVDGIIARQGARLNHQLIWEELTPLLELTENLQHGDRLKKLLS